MVALTALLILPIAVSMGLALDGARIYLVRSRLAEAVDAAALASAQGADLSEMKSNAGRLLEANFPDAYLRSTLLDVNVTALDQGRVEILARAELPMVVMSLIGAGEVTVEARAVAQRETRGLELALVLDSTGSMKGSKLADLKDASRDLLDILFGEEKESETLKVAVVPFSARVNIDKTHKSWVEDPSGWKGCVESRGSPLALSDAPPSEGKFRRSDDLTVVGWHNKDGRNVYGPYTITPPCPRELLPLSGKKSDIVDAIKRLNANGTTRIDMGARWGWRVLSERWQGLWGDPASPLPDDDRADKAVVIMTDGENVSQDYDEATPVQADANLQILCQRMKDRGYLVFTITFQAPSSVEPMMRACASDASSHYESPTPEDLRAAFRQIGNRLSALRLVE
ncbi:pilus assembly protein TadG-related protein [Geminicoccaceae bacterium 1502E]|nr:pilus assembly protein TadG-related protein [Geminicoccaceae bacterium 1502E]